jgi:hypothetical protein
MKELVYAKAAYVLPLSLCSEIKFETERGLGVTRQRFANDET